MANLFSAVTLILMMTILLACFVIAAPVRVGRQSEPQARKTLREGLIVLSNAAVSLLMIYVFYCSLLGNFQHPV